MEEFLQWAELLFDPFPSSFSVVSRGQKRGASPAVCKGCSRFPFLPKLCQVHLGSVGMPNGEMDVGTLSKKRNLKNTDLAVQANQTPAPLAFSKLPSQKPLCIHKEMRQPQEKHLLTDFACGNQDTKIHQIALLELNCPYEHSAAASWQTPRPSPSLCCITLAQPQSNVKQAQMCSVIPFFPFYSSWLCLHHLMCHPWAQEPALRRGKMNQLEMKLIWTGPRTGCAALNLILVHKWCQQNQGAKSQTQINIKKPSCLLAKSNLHLGEFIFLVSSSQNTIFWDFAIFLKHNLSVHSSCQGTGTV